MAQNMGAFNVTMTVIVKKKLACHITITVLSRILSWILSRCCHEVVTEHIEQHCCTCEVYCAEYSIASEYTVQFTVYIAQCTAQSVQFTIETYP